MGYENFRYFLLFFHRNLKYSFLLRKCSIVVPGSTCQVEKWHFKYRWEIFTGVYKPGSRWENSFYLSKNSRIVPMLIPSLGLRLFWNLDREHAARVYGMLFFKIVIWIIKILLNLLLMSDLFVVEPYYYVSIWITLAPYKTSIFCRCFYFKCI